MEEEGERVFLYVYDLTQGLAKQVSHILIGTTIEAVWHTGVIVYENEYYFGGGIQHSPIGAGPHGSPVSVVDLGPTHVPKDIFETYLEEIGPRYTAESYSLLKHNCNNFSNEVCQFLVGRGIPDYILELPDDVASSPMGALLLPLIEQVDASMRLGHPLPSKPIEKAFLAAQSETAKAEETLTGAAEAVDHRQQADHGQQAEDALGDARQRVQEEIGREFTKIMAEGTARASEAATLATRRVMEKYRDTFDIPL